MLCTICDHYMIQVACKPPKAAPPCVIHVIYWICPHCHPTLDPAEAGFAA